jgi:hypothetical protein
LCSFFQGFSCLKITSWKAPVAFPGFDRSATKEDAILPLRDANDHDFRTFIKYMTAVFADFTFPVVSFRNFTENPGTAF